MRIFIGKFSQRYPEQIEKKFYSGGEEGNPLYGGLQVGDYVFASYGGMIVGLWRAKEYTQMKNTVNPKFDGVLLFEEVKTYRDVSVTNDFTRYKYFVHNLDLVNKVTKSVKNLGFIPIQTRQNCPRPEEIEFKNNGVNIYVAFEDASLAWREGDIRVTADKNDQMKILGIHRYEDGVFNLYHAFNTLYEERNAEDGKHSIRALYDYSIEDEAPKKRKFLFALIEELESSGYFKVSNAISLYDNLLVGRKRSAGPKNERSDENNQAGEPDSHQIDPAFEDYNEDYEEIAGLINYNPNIILYGPPGTGKTFASQKIIETYERKHGAGGGSYQLAEAEGRVKSITFHQSYSYEEFIEGIRPVLNDEGGAGVGYRLENGLFKEHCINAEKELIKRKNNATYVDMIRSQSAIWKISLGERKSDEIFKECVEKGDIAIGWLDELDLSEMNYDEIFAQLLEERGPGNNPTQDANTINAFINEMSVGDIVLVYDSPQTIRMIGVITEGYRYDERYSYRQRRKTQWFKDLDYPINIHQYNAYKNLTMKTVYELVRVTVPDVLEMITDHSIQKQSLDDKKEIKPYYMIIDEINRGNIAKIFGELITLIEQDKRGKLKVSLPYSKKEFSVPGNLVIIGTMNTADRSIAAIDTALRRRFTFVEIEPDASVITRYDNPMVNDTIDLPKLLNAMNQKITDHYDRDHRIGHAYFMGIESLNNFYQTWYYKILPLLSEYFYNDVETIRSIVGRAFYDDYGNALKRSKVSQASGLSPFEESIIAIYKDEQNA